VKEKNEKSQCVAPHLRVCTRKKRKIEKWKNLFFLQTEIELLDDSMAGEENRTVNIGRNDNGTKNRLSNNSITGANLWKDVEKSYDPGKLLLDENAKITNSGRDSRDSISRDEDSTEDEVRRSVAPSDQGTENKSEQYAPMVENFNRQFNEDLHDLIA